MEALNYKIEPKMFRRFDSHARFQERSHVDRFLEILNKPDPAIKYRVYEPTQYVQKSILRKKHRF